MQVETIRDVLNWTVTFHKNLKDCLKHCSEQNKDERAQMTLHYLSDHEASLERIVQGFINTADKKALNTWCYDYIEKHPFIEHGHCDSPFKELDMTHIMEKTVNHHQQVIELYTHLYSRVDIDSAKELLDTIKGIEENEIKRMVQGVNRFSDM
ncbi:ATPase [Paraglaciecola sp. MB-3u-78]|uniref:ATPase n=1 Tax=Paraglaciecola sp. MB-3u-78 TaxID=2058332 RepID=UPI000C322266|nr:ATPase [Paraglaciecola sp. MB-3u-78]PKG99542.1 ATPase [Paraglaciecola sp. MB-3u-78]